MEARFGRDFGAVRVHDDARAAESAEAVNALAYTVGQDVVFNRGRYAPGSPAGKKLLAHELAHTIQQGPVGSIPPSLVVEPAGSDAEVQADSASEAALRATPGVNGSRAAGGPTPQSVRLGPSVTRQPIAVHREEDSLLGRTVDYFFGSDKRLFVNDLLASIKEAPDHFMEVFAGALRDAILQHWAKLSAVLILFVGGQYLVGLLAASPEPLFTKLAAVALEAIMMAVAGYFAAVEILSAKQEAANWVKEAGEAKGDASKITEASRSFLRMVLHILLALLAIAGLRAKILGVKAAVEGVGESGAATGGGAPSAASGDAPGAAPDANLPSNVIPLRRPGVPSGPVASAEGFPTSGANALKPAEVPFEEPVPESGVQPIEEPTPATNPHPETTAGPNVKPPPKKGPFPISGPDPTERNEQLRCQQMEGLPPCSDPRSAEEVAARFASSQLEMSVTSVDCQEVSSGSFDDCGGGPGVNMHCQVPGTDFVVSLIRCLCCQEDGTTGHTWNPHASPGDQGSQRGRRRHDDRGDRRRNRDKDKRRRDREFDDDTE
jgi:hypothetical protein